MNLAGGADRIVRVQLRMALACVVIAVGGGALSALHYIPSLSAALNEAGLILPNLRPIHTSFASLWIFGGSIAVIYHWLATGPEGLRAGDRRRFWFHTVCWLLAGAGILFTLPLGITSGREYLGFHPAFSVLLLAGWLALTWNVLARLRHGFWGQPVYVWFWGIGALFFIYTFVEGHAYLLPQVFANPVRDLQIQWKSCGTLVGSFNFLMYGSLIYVGERLSKDRSYAQSPIAFWLFGVGCLNSFTNYAHHTYHLPQTESVKWVAFVVSMAEIVILFKVVADLLQRVRQRRPAAFCGRGTWLVAAKWWTAVMLATSILISVPNLNSIVHGTQVVMAHAMGATVGIDTLVLLGTSCWLIGELRGPAVLPRLDAPIARWSIHWISGSLALLVGWLTVAGTVHGIHRFLGEPTPQWVVASRWVLPVVGSALGTGLLVATVRLLGLLAARPAPAAAPEAAAVPAAPRQVVERV
jgi:nitric oxide reductase subunit B